MYVDENSKKRWAEMDDLKLELKREARRHSNKLIKKINAIIDLPELIEDRIHQEMHYTILDGYRAVMKATRNGDTHEQDKNGNY